MALAVGLVLGIALDWAIIGWLLMVPTSWPYVLVHVTFVAAIVAVCGWFEDEYGSSSRASIPMVLGGVTGIGGLVLIVLILIFASPMNATKLHELGKVEIAEEQIEVADTDHIRVVPKESAMFLGNQKIGKGNLGARLEVGDYDVQRVNNEIVWLAPLEFRGFFKWLSAEKRSPGYVVVSAENIDADPRLVEGYEMQYLPSAYFGLDLHRHLYYSGYSSYSYKEATFEIDDEGKPYWVVSLTRPQAGFDGHTLQLVVVVDPETGEITEYKPGETPAWVDRAFPETVAEELSYYWGQYVHGFWNSLFGNKDVMQISGVSAESDADVFLVHNKETENSIWICGMTSPSSSDNALTGYMTMDSITGKMVFYTVDSIGTESAALQAASGAPEVARQSSYHASQAILYNVYGVETWIVPILSENNIPQMIALVYGANTQHVAVGQSKGEALEAYKNLLAELQKGNVVPTDVGETERVTDTVVRINWIVVGGKPVGYIVLNEHPNQVFAVPRDISAEMVVTQPGDSVAITYLDTTEEVVSVKSFDNLALNLTKSEPQQAVEAEEAAETSRTVEELRKQQEELQKQMDAINEALDQVAP